MCTSNTREAEAKWSRVQGQPQLHSEIWASQGYMVKPWLKTENNEPGMVAYVCNTSNQEAGAGGHKFKASLSNMKNYFKKERGVKERGNVSKTKWKYNYLPHQIHNVVTKKLIFTEYKKRKIWVLFLYKSTCSFILQIRAKWMLFYATWWWVYLNFSIINKNSGVKYQGKHLIDQRSDRKATSYLPFLSFPKALEILSKPLSYYFLYLSICTLGHPKTLWLILVS